MTKETNYDLAQQNEFLANPPRWSGYSEVTETLTIGGTDPAVVGNWESPSTQVISENSALDHLFDYTTNPGSITYIGTDDIIVRCVFNASVRFSANNAVSRFQWGKNGAPSATRFMTRKIGTGADVGSIGATRSFELSTGDYLDLFFGADTLGDLLIDHAEYSVTAVAKAYS